MLVITGRKKETLNLGGEKVSPRLIEEVLMDHHSVREALAFTVPSEFGIEEVWALTVPVDNWTRRRCIGTAEKGFFRPKFRFALSMSPSSPAPRAER
jgi:acyl-CoA synthetase (AMP-forming)/AMP-acid ligase II